jgi:glycosyltransferase involved in cell wall biosynthesis
LDLVVDKKIKVMFSIIIPLYNKAPYIEKAIQSIAAQTYQEFELIVIDDGSIDDSLEKLRVISYELQEKNPKLYVHLRIIEQENQGVSNTRNNGVKLAKYDYIAFLDADDWWESTYLEEMKALIDEFPDAGIYGSSYYKVKNRNFIPANIGVKPNFAKGNINYCKVYSKTMWMPLWTGAVIIPKQIYNEFNGFKPNLKLGEDFDLWIRIALKYKVGFINKPLSYYNQDVAQETRGVVDDKIYNPETFYTFNLNYLEDIEKDNYDLKYLLDRLRIISLFRYRLQNAYPDKVNEIISKINFKNQSLISYLQYRLPLSIVRFIYSLKKLASQLKSIIKQK